MAELAEILETLQRDSKRRHDGVTLLEEFIRDGKTNMDEYGMGSASVHSVFGPVRNPLSPTLSAGGSSGGSAAAVAAHMCYAALGSDTGGSTRQPAAFCGVVGLKPTYGLLSRRGLVAYASSLDCVGIITRTVDDAELLLDVIAGHDPDDSTSLPAPLSPPLPSSSASAPLLGVRVGIPREYHLAELPSEIVSAWRDTAQHLQQAGAEIVSVSLPHTAHALPAYYILAAAEAYSNLARYDGVRYGERSDGKSLEALYEATRATGFGAEVKRRLLTGTLVLSRRSYESHYLQAQRIRRLVLQDFERAWAAGVHTLLTPCSPTHPFSLEEAQRAQIDPVSAYMHDVMTVGASLAGLPALSVPVSRAGGGLPLGMQLIGPRLGERSLLNVARTLQRLGLLWQCEMPRAINCPRSMPCPNLPSCGFYHKAFDCLDWYETKRCKDRICKHHHRPNIHYEDASPLERKPSERDRAPSRSSSSSQSISSSSTSRSHPVSRSETSSSSDAFVAEDWRTCLSSKGEKYYYNSKTRVSVWKRPSGLREDPPLLPATKPSQPTPGTTPTPSTTPGTSSSPQSAPSAPVAAVAGTAGLASQAPGSTQLAALSTPTLHSPLPNTSAVPLTEASVGEKRALSPSTAAQEEAKRARTHQHEPASSQGPWDGVRMPGGPAPPLGAAASPAQAFPATSMPDKSMLTHTLSLVTRTLQHLRESGVVC